MAHVPLICVASFVCVACLWIAPPPFRTVAARLSVWLPLPCLIWASIPNRSALEFPWLLMGARLELDTTGRVFLGLTAALWLAAGIYGRTYLAQAPNRGQYDLFFFLTMTGNLGVTAAYDAVSFLFFYTLMSVSAYGLIVQDRRTSSLFAGKVYIALTVIGEVLLFVGMVLVVRHNPTLYFDSMWEHAASSPSRDALSALFLCGFGIKLGVMPLHFWLPLAHPAAPTPASAVLSGSMIKTGLLGIIRFVPLGILGMETLGAICIAAGALTALLAAAFGVTQRNPKTVLAYSSISQMGLVFLGIGIPLMVPASWKTALPMLLLFAVHHSVAKAALFLGVGVAGAKMRTGWSRRLVIGGLLLGALALPGLPMTTGLAAKTALKYTAMETAGEWAGPLSLFLPISSVATMLLMVRFLWLIWPPAESTAGPLRLGMALPWALLTLGVSLNWFLVMQRGLVKSEWTAITPSGLFGALWPIAVGVCALGVLAVPKYVQARLSRMQIPEGDIAHPVSIAVSRAHRALDAIAYIHVPRIYVGSVQRAGQSQQKVFHELGNRLTQWIENGNVIGLLMAVLTAILFAVMIL